jgi:hypothetical protein
MDTTLGSLRILFLGIAVLGIAALIVIYLMRRRALSPAERARWAGSKPALPVPDDLERLLRWQRKMRVVGLATLFYAGMMVGLTGALPPEAWVVRWIAFMILPAMILAGVALQFSIRCPHCSMRIGLQSSLGLPAVCERCETPLRK